MTISSRKVAYSSGIFLLIFTWLEKSHFTLSHWGHHEKIGQHEMLASCCKVESEILYSIVSSDTPAQIKVMEWQGLRPNLM